MEISLKILFVLANLLSCFVTSGQVGVLFCVEKFLSLKFQKNEHMFKKMNFLTPTALNVLHFLLSNPMKQFHEREIVRQTEVSVGAVNQILKKLHKAGLVERDRRGRANFYRANLKNPVARQFKVLFNVSALDDLVDQIKQASERVVLFGSCAEGTDVEESDIDLFVLSSDVEVVRSKISEYERMFDRRISPIVVDSRGFAKIKSKDKSLYERISRGIRLWERE